MLTRNTPSRFFLMLPLLRGCLFFSDIAFFISSENITSFFISAENSTSGVLTEPFLLGGYSRLMPRRCYHHMKASRRAQMLTSDVVQASLACAMAEPLTFTHEEINDVLCARFTVRYAILPPLDRLHEKLARLRPLCCFADCVRRC